jgi:ElaB/YqjD/DUF883 family membrane-anchored ribosome-binding protein
MSSTADADHVQPTTSTDDLRRQAKGIKQDLGQLGRTAKDVARDKLGDARKKAVEYVDEGKQRTAQYYEQGKHEASRIEDQLESYIRENPLKSMLIATGAGLLLGMLMRRR